MTWLPRWIIRRVLADFHRRLTARLHPGLNTGTAFDLLARVGAVIREMRR